MKNGKIHFIPLFFSAVAAAILFYVVARFSFLHFWRFDLLSSQHWNHILQKWQSGWVLRTSKEIHFFAALLLLIPGYLFSWFVFYKFPLKKILLLPVTLSQNRKKAKLQAESLAAAIGPADRIKAPVSKKEQKKTAAKAPSKKMQLINQLRGKKTPQHNAGQTTAENNLPAGQNTQNDAAHCFDLWEKFASDVESTGAFVIRQIQIKEIVFNLIAITENALFLISEGPSEDSDWETHDGDTPAVWKNEKGTIPSPLVSIIRIKEKLQAYIHEHLPEYSSLSLNFCIILDHGSIANPDDFMAFLEQNDLSALRMGSCKTTALPDSLALIEYIKTQSAPSSEMNDAIAVAFLDLMNAPEDGE